jgi:hypothetical protein
MLSYPREVAYLGLFELDKTSSYSLDMKVPIESSSVTGYWTY